MKAIWNDAVLADSDQTVVVEGNHYFPPDSVNRLYFQESPTHTTCPWKGEASYYNVVVDGNVNKDAAWYFIQWMTNKTNTAKIGATTGGAPRVSSYSDPTYTAKLVPEYVKTVNDAICRRLPAILSLPG